MKFRNILENILVEASKKDILINKIGINERLASEFTDICGPLSVVLFNKALQAAININTTRPDVYKMSGLSYYDGETLKEKIINYFNDRRTGLFDVFGGREELVGLMDYIRVGLYGNFKGVENLNLNELLTKSKEWHDSLEIGESKIDYKEENTVILDFRENGLGYYWADLGGTTCTEEKKRMGHCGDSAGFLYSLRNYKMLNNKHTLNESHLTASIDENGTLLQLKGPKNSKPTSEYHSLILPLLYLKVEDKFLISGVGYEYNSAYDFKISDLTEDEIKKLYQDRPELFKGRQEYKLLRKIGLVEPLKYPNFTLTIPTKRAEDYVRGEYSNIIDDVLIGNTWQYWDNSEYADWKYAVENELNNENVLKIIDLLKQKNPNITGSENLLELIEEYDEDDEIKNRVRWSVNDAEANDYENYLYNNLKKAFEEYGEVISMNDEGVVISIDLESLISNNNISDGDVDEITERCGDDDDVECIFNELLGDGYIEKPRLDVDDRWYPDTDRDNFNEILNDRLNEI
jgi:hypothetical protein